MGRVPVKIEGTEGLVQQAVAEVSTNCKDSAARESRKGVVGRLS
jgi:hypothetical protein